MSHIRITQFSPTDLYEALSARQFNKKEAAEALKISLFLLNIILKEAKISEMQVLADITEDKFMNRFPKLSHISYKQLDLHEMPFSELHQGILELGAIGFAEILAVEKDYLLAYLRQVAVKFELSEEDLFNPKALEAVAKQLKEKYNTPLFLKIDITKCTWSEFHLEIWESLNTPADIAAQWGLESDFLEKSIKTARFETYLFRIYSPFILQKYLGEFYEKNVQEVRSIADTSKLDAEAITECVKDTSIDSTKLLFNLDPSFDLSAFLKNHLKKQNPSLEDGYFSQVSSFKLEEIIKLGNYVDQKGKTIQLAEIFPPLMGEREMQYFSMFPPAKKAKPEEDVLAFMKRLNHQP